MHLKQLKIDLAPDFQEEAGERKKRFCYCGDSLISEDVIKIAEEAPPHQYGLSDYEGNEDENPISNKIRMLVHQ